MYTYILFGFTVLDINRFPVKTPGGATVQVGNTTTALNSVVVCYFLEIHWK